MNDIVVEADNPIDLSVDGVFQGSILLLQALKSNINTTAYIYQSKINCYLHQFLIVNADPLALPIKILLLIVRYGRITSELSPYSTPY